MADVDDRLFERVLIIETAGKVGQVAISSGTEVLAIRELAEARRHARDLAAFTGELLAGQGWRPADLTSVIVNIGPGSFTGLRVGIASGKALAYALNIPLLAIPAFRAIASATASSEEPLHVIADALQGFVYHEQFVWEEGSWTTRSLLRIVPLKEWLKELASPIRAVGPGIDVHRTELAGCELVQLVEERSSPCANLLDAARGRRDHFRVDPAAIEPLYLRGSSAEEKRKQTAASN